MVRWNRGRGGGGGTEHEEEDEGDWPAAMTRAPVAATPV
jgi:hypothetical protein